jgi:hypothetical protein
MNRPLCGLREGPMLVEVFARNAEVAGTAGGTMTPWLVSSSLAPPTDSAAPPPVSWVPTKMGGPSATGDLKLGYLTQTWLALSDDAAATVSGGYWYHRQRQAPAPPALDPAFQDQLLDQRAELAGVTLI